MSNENSTKKSQTDWARIDAMRDEDIDLTDCPEVTDEMWAKGELFVDSTPVTTNPQEQLSIDKDIVEFFRSKGIDYPLRINHVLREYVDEHKAR